MPRWKQSTYLFTFGIQKKGSVQKRRDLLSLDDMASDVVVLTSSESEGEEDEIQFCGMSQSKKASNFRDDDDDFPLDDDQ